jgi:hypothetical protein
VGGTDHRAAAKLSWWVGSSWQLSWFVPSHNTLVHPGVVAGGWHLPAPASREWSTSGSPLVGMGSGVLVEQLKPSHGQAAVGSYYTVCVTASFGRPAGWPGY